MLQDVTHFSSEFAHEHNYCLNGEITAEAYTAFSTLHRLMVYFRYFGTKMWNMEAHSWSKKILTVQYKRKLNLKFRIPSSRRTMKSATMVIFEESKHTVAGLLKSPMTITRRSLSFGCICINSSTCLFNSFTETEMLLFWWHFHHWLHWKLSFWQLPVQPVMKISSKWQHFRFSVILTDNKENIIASYHWPFVKGIHL